MATCTTYGNFFVKALNKEVNLLTDNIKVLLCTSAYTPNKDTQVYKDAITTNEVANGNGYTTGGALLASKTCTYASNYVTFKAADVTWSASTITARYAIIYDDTPASNKPLIAYIDFGSDFSSSAGNFTIAWDTNGIFRVNIA